MSEPIKPRIFNQVNVIVHGNWDLRDTFNKMINVVELLSISDEQIEEMAKEYVDSLGDPMNFLVSALIQVGFKDGFKKSMEMMGGK